MRHLRLSELKSLIAQPDFQDWWGQLRAAHETLRHKQRRHHELLHAAAEAEFNAEIGQKNSIDHLDLAGECEDRAATMHFEATDAENSAFQLVAQYEDLRIHVSELWYRLGALEKSLDERRELAAKPNASRKAQESLRTVTQAHQACLNEYERLSARKKELWDKVEETWNRQAETALKMSEQRMRGRRLRTETEALFAAAEKLKTATERANADADAAANEVVSAKAHISKLLSEAAGRFGCAAGEEFLYYRQRDASAASWCLALVDDSVGYNIEVHPLSIYALDPKRGVTFLELARDTVSAPDEGDKRFDDYFLSGRKGRLPAVRA